MRRLFSILLSAFLLLGLAPVANAGLALNPDRESTEFTASALTLCSENARFQERASGASTPKDVARFNRYSKASCGDDGLPHLVIAPTIEPTEILLIRPFLLDFFVNCSVMFNIITTNKNKTATAPT